MREPNQINACPNKHASVISLLEWGNRYLGDNGIDEAGLQSELLLCEVLNYSRTDLRSGYDNITGEEVIATYGTLLRRRINHEPLQYILGNTEFMGLRFIVNSSVFIPRPETELLVGAAQEICLGKKERKLFLLDAGTGSGNIAVSIARTCGNTLIDAIDSDNDTLAVAEKNIKIHDLTGRIRAVRYDMLDARETLPHEPYDMVVSNPPYIPLSEYLTLDPEVRDFEPRQACTDGADGLTFYRGIAKLCQSKLVGGGHLIVEIGYGQTAAVRKILAEAGFSNIIVRRDYAGIDRIMAGEMDKQ
jgi:release factor glutamine methyltransferase